MKLIICFFEVSLIALLFGCGVAGGDSYIEPNYDPYSFETSSLHQVDTCFSDDGSLHYSVEQKKHYGSLQPCVDSEKAQLIEP